MPQACNSHGARVYSSMVKAGGWHVTANPTTGMEEARNREAIENALYAFGTLRVALTVRRSKNGRSKQWSR